MKNTTITCALPYSNGNLHLGHFYEATLADIKSRYLKETGHPHYFISGNDCHGAATTLYCLKHNLNIANHLAAQHIIHLEAYKALKVDFTSFSQTNIPLHEFVVNWCIENILDYEQCNNVKILEERNVLSWFDKEAQQFLPDRYVVGTCPYCGALEQHPEVCEGCGKSIAPEDIKSPTSVLSANPVVLENSAHLTLNTKGFYENLKNYSHLLHPSIRGKIFDGSLAEKDYLDISRDSPYYGIEVKHFSRLHNQFYYVWFDAPIAYLTFSFQLWLENRIATKELFGQFLQKVHFEHTIGKDISYFHTFLWINLLNIISDGQATIEKIHVHGWITNKSQKLSKNKGHQFNLQRFSPTQIDALRLYFFAKYDGSIHDVEFKDEDVYQLYNQVVVNGIANFYARTIKLVERYPLLIEWSENLKVEYSELIRLGNYKKLCELVIADLGKLNIEFQEAKLWEGKLSNEKTKELLLEFLSSWYSIYQILVLVCPSLSDGKEAISQIKFIHLAEKLPAFSWFDRE